MLMNLERYAKRDGQKGFTLLELLVVLLIIALLVGYVGPRYFAQVDRARVSETRTQMKGVGDALQQFRLDVGRYPTAEEGLQALMTAPANVPNWQGPYMAKAIPLDPWGHPYLYRAVGAEGKVEVYSLGKNGKPGDKGPDGEIAYDL